MWHFLYVCRVEHLKMACYNRINSWEDFMRKISSYLALISLVFISFTIIYSYYNQNWYNITTLSRYLNWFSFHLYIVLMILFFGLVINSKLFFNSRYIDLLLIFMGLFVFLEITPLSLAYFMDVLRYFSIRGILFLLLITLFIILYRIKLYKLASRHWLVNHIPIILGVIGALIVLIYAFVYAIYDDGIIYFINWIAWAILVLSYGILMQSYLNKGLIDHKTTFNLDKSFNTIVIVLFYGLNIFYDQIYIDINYLSLFSMLFLVVSMISFIISYYYSDSLYRVYFKSFIFIPVALNSLLIFFADMYFVNIIPFLSSLLIVLVLHILKQSHNEDKSQYTFVSPIPKTVLLTIITFGIFGIVWLLRLIKTQLFLKSNTHKSSVMQLVLILFVPFYIIFWLYKTESDFYKLRHMYTSSKDNSNLYLIISILGFGFLALLLLQNDTNEYLLKNENVTIISQNGLDDLKPSIPNESNLQENSIEQKLIKLKDLRDRNLIDDDEYKLEKGKLLRNL